MERLQKANNYGRTITMKVKTNDFKTLTRRTSKDYYIKDKDEIMDIAQMLLDQNIDTFDSIRLMGLTTSNLELEELEESTQLEFKFDPKNADARKDVGDF